MSTLTADLGNISFNWLSRPAKVKPNHNFHNLRMPIGIPEMISCVEPGVLPLSSTSLSAIQQCGFGDVRSGNVNARV